MRVPPERPTAAEVLDAVRRHWAPEARSVVHLPLGFGAHHWRVDGGASTLFATIDLPSPTRSEASFERAYRGAHALAAAGLPGVHAPLPSLDGRLTADCGGGLLSVTAWLEGRSPTMAEAELEEHRERVLALVAGLHAAPVPPGLARWTPRVAEDLAERLAAATVVPWGSGPHAEEVRRLLRDELPRIASVERRYRQLRGIEERTAGRRVPTHGEPHAANQVLTGGVLLLVDWETLALAPPERDLVSFPVDLQRSLGADHGMIELFALEWMLSEVEEYQRWFRAPHTGDEDDRIALEGLKEELQR